MLSAWRDFLLSFCPAAVRRGFPPESPLRTLRFATWGGMAQFFVGAFASTIRYKSYFALRAGELAPHLGGTTEVFQAGTAVIVTLEYLAHPLSLFLLYLAIEGLVRFAGGLITAEVLPNFIVFLAFKAASFAARRRERRRIAALPPDTLEDLSGGGIRITSAQPKRGWNASITIGVDGQWFEVESTEETGPPPRSYVYFLRPSPPGKILRGYEEYDPRTALKVGHDLNNF